MTGTNENASTERNPERRAADHLIATELVAHGDVTIEARVYATDAEVGEWVTLVPSLGRGAADFTEEFGSTLTRDLVEAGYRVVLIEPRGFGRSTGSFAAVSMEDLANDLKAVFDALGIAEVHIVGHAFGNRLSRSFAAFHPDYIADVALLAAGGDFELSAEQSGSLVVSTNPDGDPTERREAIDRAFFAEGNDPDIWLDGWSFELAVAQAGAVQTIDPAFFKRAGGKDILVVQPSEDVIAPPELAGRVLAEELGDQVTLVEVEHAGHALLPEQPEAVTAALLEFFAR